jgi:L-lactate dehydrogenase complex protein LldF
VRGGLRIWAFFVRRPALYHFAAGLKMRALAALGRRKGRFGRLPFAAGWTAYRDFPAPQGRTFQQLWAKRSRP